MIACQIFGEGWIVPQSPNLPAHSYQQVGMTWVTI